MDFLEKRTILASSAAKIANDINIANSVAISSGAIASVARSRSSVPSSVLPSLHEPAPALAATLTPASSLAEAAAATVIVPSLPVPPDANQIINLALSNGEIQKDYITTRKKLADNTCNQAELTVNLIISLSKRILEEARNIAKNLMERNQSIGSLSPEPLILSALSSLPANVLASVTPAVKEIAVKTALDVVGKTPLQSELDITKARLEMFRGVTAPPCIAPYGHAQFPGPNSSGVTPYGIRWLTDENGKVYHPPPIDLNAKVVDGILYIQD